MGNKMRFLYFGNFIMAFPFYCIGFYYKKKILHYSGLKYSRYIVPFLLILFSLLVSFNGRISVLGVNFGTSMFPLNCLVFYINAMIGSFVMLIISANINCNNHLVVLLANSLITSLCAQYFFNYPIKYTIGWNQPFYITLPLSVTIFMCCFVIHQLIVRFAPILVGKKIYI